jgi:uncharacterized surface protein with fasciclin (FAS1) repeats
MLHHRRDIMSRKLITTAALAVLAMAPTAVAAQAPTKNIVQTAIDAGSFTTLAAALEAADLLGVLQGEGPFTVFAPTDEAFAKLPAGTVESLLADTEALTRILTYHVVSGRVTADAVVKTAEVQTVAGIKAPIEVKMGSVYVAGAKVIGADVAASNGIIHIIDSVMLPPAR